MIGYKTPKNTLVQINYHEDWTGKSKVTRKEVKYQHFHIFSFSHHNSL